MVVPLRPVVLFRLKKLWAHTLEQREPSKVNDERRVVMICAHLVDVVPLGGGRIFDSKARELSSAPDELADKFGDSSKDQSEEARYFGDILPLEIFWRRAEFPPDHSGEVPSTDGTSIRDEERLSSDRVRARRFDMER